MSLDDYRAAHRRWLDWLDGDPVHSINGQLSQLMWQDAVFRTFNEARKATATAGKALYEVLTDAQKKLADDLIMSPMGGM